LNVYGCPWWDVSKRALNLMEGIWALIINVLL
jgi:hypothetical protein